MNETLRERVGKCRRHGWTCRLRGRHVRLLIADALVWMDHGLDPAVIARAAFATRKNRGIRLSVEEVRAVTLPAPELLREEGS